jgi:hypothetical protein
MKNHWLQRKQEREFMENFPKIIGGPIDLPSIITLDTTGIPPSITVDWANPYCGCCGGTCISTAQWDGPGLPPSVTITVQQSFPVIVDGIQLPKEINVSTPNQGVC